MTKSTDGRSVDWLIEAIRLLPPDVPVAAGQQGYNNYNIQKDHWLGWLALAAGISGELLGAAERAANDVRNLRSKCGAIRKVIPWAEAESALSRGC